MAIRVHCLSPYWATNYQMASSSWILLDVLHLEPNVFSSAQTSSSYVPSDFPLDLTMILNLYETVRLWYLLLEVSDINDINYKICSQTFSSGVPHLRANPSCLLCISLDSRVRSRVGAVVWFRELMRSLCFCTSFM